jgi:hypothetical protein
MLSSGLLRVVLAMVVMVMLAAVISQAKPVVGAGIRGYRGPRAVAG